MKYLRTCALSDVHTCPRLVAVAEHGAPLGALPSLGYVQARDLDSVLSPHVTEHTLHDVHDVQRPSTVVITAQFKRYIIYISWNTQNKGTLPVIWLNRIPENSPLGQILSRPPVILTYLAAQDWTHVPFRPLVPRSVYHNVEKRLFLFCRWWRNPQGPSKAFECKHAIRQSFSCRSKTTRIEQYNKHYDAYKAQ